jgi:hypothetical protein
MEIRQQLHLRADRYQNYQRFPRAARPGPAASPSHWSTCPPPPSLNLFLNLLAYPTPHTLFIWPETGTLIGPRVKFPRNLPLYHGRPLLQLNHSYTYLSCTQYIIKKISIVYPAYIVTLLDLPPSNRIVIFGFENSSLLFIGAVSLLNDFL